MQVLSYLLRIGEYKSFAGKTIGNNVYMELNGLSEVELSMVKLENVREVLFQALLLDDIKYKESKMYAEVCIIYVLY